MKSVAVVAHQKKAMSLSLDQLEQVLTEFFRSSSDEQRLPLDQILTECTNSPDFPSLVLQAVQKSSNSALISFCVTAFARVLHKKKEKGLPNAGLTVSQIEEFFSILMQRVLAERGNPSQVPHLRCMISLMAELTSIDNDLFSRYQQMPPNILLYYFDDVIVIQKNSIEITPLSEIQNNNSFFFQIILQADLCSQTFNLMSNLQRDNEDLMVYIPLFKKGMEMEECVPGLLNFFESIMSIPLIEQNEIPFYIELLNMYMDFAESTDDLQVASFIWYNIIDANFDFLSNLKDEFVLIIFMRFFNSLSKFLEYDPDEFYTLFYICANCLTYIPDGSEHIIPPLIEQYFDYLIALIDSSLSFCNAQIVDCLYTFSDYCQEDYPKSPLSEILSAYYNKKIPTLTEGVVFVFAYAPDSIMKLFATKVSVDLSLSPNPPLTTIYFLRFFCRYAADAIEPLIEICYSAFDKVPLKILGKTFISLAQAYPNYFINNPNKLLPLLEIIRNSDYRVAQPYIITFFTLFQNFTESENNHQLMQEVGSYVILHANRKIENPEDLKNLSKFLVRVIKSCEPTTQLMSLFLSSLFQQIVQILNPYSMENNDEVQQALSDIFFSALQKKWVADRQIIFNWIDTVITVFPVPSHFDILYELYDLLPSENFVRLLEKIETFPPDLLEAEALFFSKVSKKDPVFVSQFPIDLLLYPLRFSSLCKPTLTLFIHIFKSNIELPGKIINTIAKTILTSYFTVCPNESWYPALKALRLIGFKYTSPNEMMKLIIAFINPQESKFTENNKKLLNTCIFCFISQESSKQNIAEVANTLIQIYHSSHPKPNF